jgi:acyl-CoA-binding protein
MTSDLDLAFKEAFSSISELNEAVAPDIMLKFYAYYKQATFGSNFPFDVKLDVRNAFKINAWMQLKNMSAKQAKKEYIKLAMLVLKAKIK